MFNKDFARDWKIFGGEINILCTKHFSLDFDKDFVGLEFTVSPVLKIIHIQVLNLILRIW